jgi:uncharacterized Tic20 family protein
MNSIKRFFGMIWLLLGPLAMWWLIKTALAEIVKKPVMDTKIQWAVFIVVFLPIAFGMMIFGVYAMKGYYDHLPESSAEIEED